VTQIAVLSTDERLVEALKASGLKAGRIGPEDLASYSRSAVAPQVLVLDVRGLDHLPAALAAFRREHPDAGAVLVVSSLDPRIMLEGMRAGVSECVAEPITPKALEEAVRRVLTSATPEPAGQVFAFVGAKGGVGTSTLAVNTAAALGRLTRSAALLVDLHIGHGDDAVFLGVEPRFTVLDAFENIQKIDESFFAGLVEKTDASVHLLAAPNRPRPNLVDARRTRALIEAASQHYRATVIDVPRSDMMMLDSLDASTTIVVVTTREMASVRSAARIAEMLRQRYGAQRTKVVINRFHRDAAIAQEDVERVVGGEVKHTLPSDYKIAVEALNSGKPVVLEKESRLGSAFLAFARDLAGIVKERAERPSSVLGRLAWRRA
jgi:pilus assembly protein CpaE